VKLEKWKGAIIVISEEFTVDMASLRVPEDYAF
jgi:hypothetical protein